MLFKNFTAHMRKTLTLGTLALGLYSQTTLAATGVNCVDWVSGDTYVTGNIVIYQGGYYIAEHDNPGYTPTVSTWFWDPITSAACSTSSFTKLVEAENYTSMSGVQLEATSDAGGGQNVGWIDTGDWLSYANITISTSGSYKIEYRIASVGGGSLAANLNTNAIQFPAVAVTATGAWQTWATVSQTVNINAGTYTFGVNASAGGWNINWIKFTQLTGVSSSVPSSKSSSSVVSSKSSSSAATSKSSSSVATSKSSSLSSKFSSSSSSIKNLSSSSVSSATLWQSTKLTDAVFTTAIEGPAVDANGDLYVANFNHDGSIGKIANGTTTTPTLFVDLPQGSISAGIRFDTNNNMYATDYINHNIFKINVTTKAISIYAHNTTMNQPNDLTIMANGIIFASDPNWNKDSGQLWRIETNGVTTLLSTTMGTTNGIEVSPDNKTLYVSESVQRTIWKFDIDSAGNISNKRIFKQFDTAGLDGMRVTPNGNLFVARYGAGSVVVLSPAGAVLREVALLGVNPTNLTFSRDYKKCFVTLQDKRWVEVFNIE
jgi:sugar lactone lactonase YvrE